MTEYDGEAQKSLDHTHTVESNSCVEVQSDDQYPKLDEYYEERKSRKGTWLMIGCVVLAAVCAVTAVYAGQNKTNQSSSFSAVNEGVGNGPTMAPSDYLNATSANYTDVVPTAAPTAVGYTPGSEGVPTAAPTDGSPMSGGTPAPTAYGTSTGTYLPTVAGSGMEETATYLPTVAGSGMEGTASPTGAYTPEATTCTSTFVEASQSCFVYGTDPISIDFENCEALEEDWIGIYPEYSGNSTSLSKSLDPNALNKDALVDWKWTCGSSACTGSPVANALDFNLKEGTYVAYLVHRNEGGGEPYVSFQSSSTFKVASSC